MWARTVSACLCCEPAASMCREQVNEQLVASLRQRRGGGKAARHSGRRLAQHLAHRSDSHRDHDGLSSLGPEPPSPGSLHFRRISCVPGGSGRTCLLPPGIQRGLPECPGEKMTTVLSESDFRGGRAPGGFRGDAAKP